MHSLVCFAHSLDLDIDAQIESTRTSQVQPVHQIYGHLLCFIIFHHINMTVRAYVPLFVSGAGSGPYVILSISSYIFCNLLVSLRLQWKVISGYFEGEEYSSAVRFFKILLQKIVKHYPLLYYCEEVHGTPLQSVSRLAVFEILIRVYFRELCIVLIGI